MRHQTEFFSGLISKFLHKSLIVQFSMSKYGHSLLFFRIAQQSWKSLCVLILWENYPLLSYNVGGKLHSLKIVELQPLVFVSINWVCLQLPKPCSFLSTWEYSDWFKEKTFTSSKPGREFFFLVSWVWRLMKSIHLCHVLLTRIKHRNSGQKGNVRKVDCRPWPPRFATIQTSLAFWNHVLASILLSWASWFADLSFLTFYIQADLCLLGMGLVSFFFSQNLFIFFFLFNSLLMLFLLITFFHTL